MAKIITTNIKTIHKKLSGIEKEKLKEFKGENRLRLTLDWGKRS